MNRIIFVSGFTNTEPYKTFATNLIKRLVDFKLTYNVREYTDRGSRLKNTHAKAQIIERMLNVGTCDVVWLDADSDLLKYPVLFENIPKEIQIAAKISDILTTGVLYLRNTQTNRDMCREWVQACEDEGVLLDDQVLNKIYKKYHEPEAILNLPHEYTKMECHIDDKEKLVIQQFRASQMKNHEQYLRNVRFHGNKICLIRNDPDTIAKLDSMYDRIDDKTWTQRIKVIGEGKDFAGLENSKECIILGKGPSIDKLTSKFFKGQPIYAINDSIKVAERLTTGSHFCVLQDRMALGKVIPLCSTLLCSPAAYAQMPNFTNKYCYGTKILDTEIHPNTPTVIPAILIASMFHKKINLVGFDSLFNNNFTYSKEFPERENLSLQKQRQMIIEITNYYLLDIDIFTDKKLY